MEIENEKNTDHALTIAIGTALAIINAVLERADIVKSDEFAQIIEIMASLAQEEDEARSHILLTWSEIIGQNNFTKPKEKPTGLC